MSTQNLEPPVPFLSVLVLVRRKRILFITLINKHVQLSYYLCLHWSFIIHQVKISSTLSSRRLDFVEICSAYFVTVSSVICSPLLPVIRSSLPFVYSTLDVNGVEWRTLFKSLPPSDRQRNSSLLLRILSSFNSADLKCPVILCPYSTCFSWVLDVSQGESRTHTPLIVSVPFLRGFYHSTLSPVPSCFILYQGKGLSVSPFEL